MRIDADTQRSHFFKNLSAALWDDLDDDDDNSTFAGGEYITPNQHGNSFLQSLHVEGVGEVRLPLSPDDFVKLLGVSEQAPYGHGQATIVNPEVRRAWQDDASKVTFPQSPDFVSNTVLQLANGAVRELGLDGAALQLEAHLYKQLLYEKDGHFSAHRDTEKEPGMFATLITQLPTQGGFEGGSLLVRHGGSTKTFDFSLDSATKLAYTVFYADCEHELQRITSGKRLCLAFNLVRRNVSFDIQLEELQGFSSRLFKVEVALRLWREALTRGARGRRGDVFTSDKLATPLERRPWLDVHLCILTLHKRGVAQEGGDYKRRRRYLDSEDGEADDRLDDCHSMEDVIEESVEASNWVDIYNRRCNFALEIDQCTEVVVDEEYQEGPFDEEGAGSDEVQYQGNMGNYGPTLEYWYHTAMLVIWPKRNP